jgi:DNA-binding CsgD family transcriptional regulator
MSSAPALVGLPRPAALVSLGTRAKAVKPASVGLILLQSSLKPIYWNSEALAIFVYPNPSMKVKVPSPEFSEWIRSIAGKPRAGDFPTTTHFMSGRRRYLCRTFLLGPESWGSSGPAIAITLERARWMLLDLAARFQLTDREIETVQHVAHGLTSKEIAQRMNISPNTVKTFLRLVMIKMGVTTRSGVVGKLIDGAHPDDE